MFRRLFVASLFVGLMLNSIAQAEIEPARVEPMTNAYEIKIMGNTMSGDGWCHDSFMNFGQALQSQGYTYEGPEQLAADGATLSFCDSVKVTAPSVLSYFKFLQERYADCFTMTIDEEAKIVKLAFDKEGWPVQLRLESESLATYVAPGGAETVVAREKESYVQNRYYCSPDLAARPSEDDISDWDALILKAFEAAGKLAE